MYLSFCKVRFSVPPDPRIIRQLLIEIPRLVHLNRDKRSYNLHMNPNRIREIYKESSDMWLYLVLLILHTYLRPAVIYFYKDTQGYSYTLALALRY